MIPTIPKQMAKRCRIWRKAMKAIVDGGINHCFDKETTIHAGLCLRWMKRGLQKKEVAPVGQYQIVIATIFPGQKSEAHLHETGASTFACVNNFDELGHVFEEKKLIYRTGRLLDDGTTRLEEETECSHRYLRQILPYQIHQFENQGAYCAHILIVTHPTICVDDDNEDIYLFPDFGKK